MRERIARRRPRRTRLLLLGLVAVLAGAVGAAVATTHVLDRVEGAAIDVRFAIRGTRHPNGIAVVAIDTATLTTPGVPRWPWPRSLQGRLVRAVHQAGARLIVYDIQITQATTRAQDESLARAVSASRPVVMVTGEVGRDGATQILGGNAQLRAIGALPGWDQFPVASDGEIRHLAPSFSGLDAVALVAARAAGHPVALASGDRPLIDFPGPPGTIPAVSAVTLLRHPASLRAQLRGKIVVIGATASAIGDQHAVAAGGGTFMSGPELQADSILSALHDFPLHSAPPGLEVLLVVLCAVLVPAVAARRSATMASIVGLAWAALGALLVQLAFDGNLVFAVGPAASALIVTIAGVNVVDLVTVRRERSRLEETFARYVPLAHARRVATLLESGRGLADELEATVMFCDLRGWTGIAEHLPAPTLLEDLNRYLAIVSDAVMDGGGTVVTFLGDGVMAVFGAPLPSEDHAARALAAARRVLAEIGGERVGIGLATGPVVSGTVGSGRRLEYAAVGDTTNVAARVQALTREFGRPLLLTAAVREQLPESERDRLVALGTHSVRGREEPLELWADGDAPDRSAA